MRRTTTWLSIVTLALATSAAPALANKPAGATKPPKPTVTKTQAPKSSTKAPKPAKVSAPKAAKASAPKAAKATSPKGLSKKTSTTTTASTGSTGSPTTPTTPVWTNDVAQKLSTKPNHLAKLETALGLGTLTPEQINGATSGVKNFGQLNAMVNTVLNNPTVEFADLKALMTGLDMKGQAVPGQTSTLSLGQAKQKLGLADTDGDAPTTTQSSTTTSTPGKSKKRTNSGGTQ